MKKTTFRVIIALILAAAIAIAIGVGSSWYTNWNVPTWFHNWGQSNINRPGVPIKDGNADITDGRANGIKIVSARIPREAYTANGISPQVDTAFMLTATVLPEDAANKYLDWSVMWQNPESAWANGKEVTDYITVTPTDDGALTALVECKSGFGEVVEVSAQIRDGSDDLNATCVINYVQRYLGRNFGMACGDLYSWNFDYTNLNPVVDLPQSTSPEYWFFWLGESTNIVSEAKLSEVYTKSDPVGIHVDYFCATEEYLNAIRAAGITPKVSAEQYIDITGQYDFIRLFFTGLANGIPETSSQWSAYRTALRNNASKPMFRIKIQSLCDSGAMYETIYNVHISASSLTTLATSVSFDNVTIDI